MEESRQAASEDQDPNPATKRGGWITSFFIAGSLGGLTVAAGWNSNLIVYLIQEFHVDSIDAAQISNIVNGCTSLFPVIGAVIADSLGCFPVIAVSSVISLLGVFLIGISAVFKSLRPLPCQIGSILCASPSRIQFAVLYSGIALASVGIGGTRYTLATMGADQYDNSKDQDIFFNWFFFILNIASIVCATAIVYIQDNVSWAWGYGICLAANALGLVIFVLGKRVYRLVKSLESPFVVLARVVVAAIRKRKLAVSNRAEEYYYGGDHHGGVLKIEPAPPPTMRFRFLNRAALKTDGDIASDGSRVIRPWRLCTVQQVEDLKDIIRIMPLWSSSICLGTPIGIQASLTVLQALSMDRHLGPHFLIPAGSMLVVTLICVSISLTLIDRFLFPACKKLTGQSPTPFHRIGIGHLFNILSMAVSALVEARRLKTIRKHHLESQPGSIAPMLALWLFPQLILVGVGEAFHFPGQVALYYQEFPASMKNTATAMIAVIIGLSFYLSTLFIDVVRKITDWLPNNINSGRLDNMYWVLVGVGVINFGYYLVCAKFYKYQNVTLSSKDDPGLNPDK